MYKLLKRDIVKERMTGKERYLAALEGKSVDRIPVGSPTSVATIEQMKETGAFFPESHYIPDKIAKLAVAAHTVLGYDAIMPYFSVWIGAATLGARVEWGDENMMPYSRSPLWKSPDQITFPGNISQTEPARALLEAIEKLSRQHPEACIIGKVMGPWTLSYHVHGLANFLTKTIRSPEEVRRSLNRLSEFTVRFGELQIKAGADVLCIADHATGDLISPEMYVDLLLPVHKRITTEFTVPLILHCCGDTFDRLQYFEEAGWDAYHMESRVDAFEAKREIHKMKIIGNINDPTTLLSGTPDDVKREALYAARAGLDILAPECAIPTSVTNRNLRAILDVSQHLQPMDLEPCEDELRKM